MKIKDIFKPVITEDKIIFGLQSNCIEIENNDIDLQEFIILLDHGISKTDLISKSSYDETSISYLLEQLDNYGLLEDDSDNMKLTEWQKERYKTNINYFKNYSNLNNSSIDFQSRLSKIKVLILGVGGYSILASALASMGIENLTLVDYDVIELSNLSRQFLFTEEDIGKLKVDVAKDRIVKLNSSCNVTTYNMCVKNPDDIMDIVKEVDIVINALDTPPIECTRWVNYCCVIQEKPLFQVGLSTNTLIVEKFTYKQGCYDCNLISQLENNFSETKHMIEYAYSNKLQDINTAFAPNILVSTGMLANEICNYILGIGQENEGNEESALEMNLQNYSIKQINMHSKKSYCPTCSMKRMVSTNELMGMVKTNGN